MARYAMAIDLSSCVGCAACAVACKLENEVPPGASRLWIRLEESGTFPDLAMQYRPEQCMQCADPPCVGVCPTGASHVNDDGIVLVDAETCIACGACIAACPFGAVVMGAEGAASKCDGCADEVACGWDPTCVRACPMRAPKAQ